MRKIAAFEAEMAEYARQHGKMEGFVMHPRAQKQLFFLAQNRNQTIESVLDELRPGIQEIILAPEKGTPMAEWSEEEFARYLKGTGRLH